MTDDQITDISAKLTAVFTKLITEKVTEFEVLDKKYLPYGLKPHTRSICWLAEQVILQNLKKLQTDFDIYDYDDPISDIAPWDAKLKLSKSDYDKDIYINLKVTDVTKPVRRNDIASVKALLNFYDLNNDALIYFVVVRLKFDDIKIKFEPPVTVRYYPWIKEFVVNPRNRHLQSIYDVDLQARTADEFVALLREKALEKGLSY